MDFQLIEALTEELVFRKVNMLIDFTEHPYYGKRDDKMIKGTSRARGTKKMRHYLGFSILLRDVHIYAGLEHVANGQSKIPIILDFLSHLLDLGFELNYVLMNREFYRAELINKIKLMGGNVITPAKRYKKVKALVTDYFEDKRDRVMSYSFSMANEARHRFSSDDYLIIKAKRGYTLKGVKRDLACGRISLKEVYQRVFAIMTTQKSKGKTSSWASHVALSYRRRWLIETGFSDLNRINRQWRSNHDGVRYLDVLARMLLYNSWKLNKKIVQLSTIRAVRTSSWTLNQNLDRLKEAFLSAEKKSCGVVG
ncbi:MAG: transposase [Promethearchaeota archaeon]